MPLFYQRNINQFTKLAVWEIKEDENFFTQQITLQRNITHPHKRLQHLAGRYLLQYLYPSFSANDISFNHANKPFSVNKDVHFSISHCGNYAATIINLSNRVGIDIEIPTNKILKIAPKFLHQLEIENLQIPMHLHTPKLIHQLTLLWSCKEAVFKWCGNGQINFSEMIRIQPFSLADNGIIKVNFKQYILTIEYKMFENLCLAWVVDK